MKAAPWLLVLLFTCATAYAGQFKDVVVDFGAIPNDGISDLVAFQAACAAAVQNESIFVPAGNYSSLSTFTCSKNIRWIADAAQNGTGLQPIAIPGIVETNFGNRKMIRRTKTADSDYADLEVQHTVTHTGGTPNLTTAPLRQTTTIPTDINDNIWGITSTVSNASPHGYHTSIYGYMERLPGAGWGAASVLNFTDKEGANDPTSGQVTLETDHEGNGTDNSIYSNQGRGSKVLHNMAVGKENPEGPPNEVGFGLWATCFHNNNAECKYKRFVSIDAPFDYGADFSTGTQTPGGAAVKMAAYQCLEIGRTTAGAPICLRYNSGNNKVEILNNGVIKQSWPM